MKAMNTNQRSVNLLSSKLYHFNNAQKVKLVKNELIAYTSASTALNQKVSINVFVKAATIPAPKMSKLRLSDSLSTNFSANITVIQ